MKNKLITLCLLVTGTVLYAQPVKISGMVNNKFTGTSLKLTNLDEANVTIPLTAGKRFSATVPDINKGMYTLQGVGSIYLQPGYELNIEPGKGDTYRFTGKGGLENNLLYESKSLLPSLVPYSVVNDNLLFTAYNMSVDTFLQRINAYKAKASSILNRSASEYFKDMANRKLDYYCLGIITDYRLYYGTDSLKREAFYKFIEKNGPHLGDPAIGKQLNVANDAMHQKKFTAAEKSIIDSLCRVDWKTMDASLFRNSEEYRKAVANQVTTTMYREFSQNPSARKEQQFMKLMVTTKYIRDAYIGEYYTYTYTSDLIKMSKDSLLKDSLYNSFMAADFSEVHKLKIKEVYNNFISYSKNRMAPDFIFSSISGEKISLKSLRGKYVYIDVWATWCGPCKAEIPYLTKMEKELEGGNVQFVSLSVDMPGDKKKWEAYVKTNSLGGIQLITDNAFDTDFIRKFNINSIPRFILIDPNGMIVESDAKRPSNPELKKTLAAL